MVAQVLVGAVAPAACAASARAEQADFVEPGQALPVGRGFRRRLHAIGGTAQGKKGGELSVQPAGEVAHRGVDAHERGLRQLVPLQRFQKGFGY